MLGQRQYDHKCWCQPQQGQLMKRLTKEKGLRKLKLYDVKSGKDGTQGFNWNTNATASESFWS